MVPVPVGFDLEDTCVCMITTRELFAQDTTKANLKASFSQKLYIE